MEEKIEIKSDQCYKTIADLPEIPDCVDMVVSPDRGMKMLDDIKLKGIKTIWFQPGTYNDEVIEKSTSLGLELIYDHCVLVELSKR